MKLTRNAAGFGHEIFLITVLLAYGTPNLARAQAHDRDQQKILAGYFEEWSIYAANYNVANLQANGVAHDISHLLYAFGNVAPTSGAPDAPTAACRHLGRLPGSVSTASMANLMPDRCMATSPRFSS